MSLVFKDIIDRRITNIQRIDCEKDYEYFAPYGLVLTLENMVEQLLFTSIAKGIYTDIQLINSFELPQDYSEKYILNDLKFDDELMVFINQKIKQIRVAVFRNTEIQGDGFSIKQGKLAGIELLTDRNKLLFQGQNGNAGWIDIDDDFAEIPN